MLHDPREWYPGSFTKNFTWGPVGNGLLRLHSAIKIAFDDQLRNTRREVCLQRLEGAGYVWHIPLNFFLINMVVDGQNMVLVDELVYQAISFEHSSDFDKLALIAFNNSFAGSWHGAYSWQRYPAPWAFHYVTDKISRQGNWDTSAISARDIDTFISSSGQYQAQHAGKVSTNLNYMYLAGGISEMAGTTITRWWVNCVFLILDRVIVEGNVDGDETSVSDLVQLITAAGFQKISGQQSKNRQLALAPLVSLYKACGGMDRWSVDAVRERQLLRLPEINYFANSDDPFYAIYPRDPNVIKSIPRACAMLAKDVAGFEEIDATELQNWNIVDYVKNRTKAALKMLRERGVTPIMTSDDLLKLTRGE